MIFISIFLFYRIETAGDYSAYVHLRYYSIVKSEALLVSKG